MTGWAVYRRHGNVWVKAAWVPVHQAKTEDEALAVYRRARGIVAKRDDTEYLIQGT